MQMCIKTSVNLNSSCYSENPKQSDWFVKNSVRPWDKAQDFFLFDPFLANGLHLPSQHRIIKKVTLWEKISAHDSGKRE